MNNSGEGSRPVTDGGVDNIGAAKTFDPKQKGAEKPAAREKMSDKRADAASIKNDDSAPLDMTGPAHGGKNTEPPETARENNEER